MSTLIEKVNVDRLVRDTLDLVNTPSITGDTREVSELYMRMLQDAGCTVERYEFISNNPTLVATYDGGGAGKTVIFNGHMDVIPLTHEPAFVKDGRVYGRGTCDMKGSLACIAEVVRVVRDSGVTLPGKLVIIANSLHESPGGHGEDLMALVEKIDIRADAAVVMEGATYECSVAQLGSATFEIAIERDGEPSHQLHTPSDTPHPITVAAEIIQKLNGLNAELEKEYIEYIGSASYFVGSIHSGQFYNQFPNKAELVGVRRYAPHVTFAEVESEMMDVLNRIAERNRVRIGLDLKKVRDGYRIDPNDPAVASLTRAISKIRSINPPLAGKKLVTDASIFVNALGISTLCYGPDQRSAHGDVEFVEISELELTAKVYLQFIHEFTS
ncbi:M20/M25/M40 family metallo-hydrolase [Paenibacillus sp. LMG 31456]|uniref:M20/M25/M40 family metallo-hydrolase n=1 Tax=Paenibacillus foliorum TaxID=2654974 RepID=A0A972K2K5_9BACL|nr:M20 family metallopeptidase [Paenibacillus foliorum]NOU97839.1 M20/M25/M40 family metallo-hydrolase [Paenibacillus foliorum]